MMEKVSWKDEYSVGVEKLDQQHRQILEIADKLTVQAGTSADPGLISATLTAMLQYAREHFTTEEELMAEYGYAETEQQKRQHAFFLKRLAEISIRAMEAKQSTAVEIMEFLKNWWLIHILKWDMKYKDFFYKKKLHSARFERSVEML